MNVIITMAGLGQRFQDAGYTLPKYKITVCGRSLFSWAIESLRNFIQHGTSFVFIVRKNENASDFISRECTFFSIKDLELVELNSTTDGQATTVLHAENAISDVNDPIAIYNIDTYVEPEYLQLEAIRGHGWIPCFAGEGNHWSFARLGPDECVVEVREKKRISPHATIGLYWFDSFSLYKQAYDKYYSMSTHMEFNEKYIAPIYNQLINDGLNVYIHEIPLTAVHGLGTPEEVEAFAASHEGHSQFGH